MTGLVAGKRLLITGVLNDHSIAYAVAQLARDEGAEIALTSFGRAKSITERVAKRLGAPVYELDAANDSDYEQVAATLKEQWGGVDGVLHAIAFAPPGCFGAFTAAKWDDASTAIRISAYSLSALAANFAPLMGPHGSFVGLDFDGARVWPGYNWMGVSKAALESIARYLAWELGRDQLRVNLVSAGPLKTVASGALGNFQEVANVWDERAPLGWNWKSPEEVARTCVFLLSDWSRGMTGEILHVDGGVHVMGGRT